MTNRELYRYTFREMNPSEEAVQNLLRVVDTPSMVKGMNYRLKWAVLLVVLLAGAVGCGYAIKAHMTQIQTTEYTYFEEYEQQKQAALEAQGEP